jgi:hypothetical protein
MPGAMQTNLVMVTVPTTDRFVVNHHNDAKAAIEAMSASRQYGAETNLPSCAGGLHHQYVRI